MTNGYVNGYVERKPHGKYEGTITIDGINLGKIIAVYFKENDKTYLWLKRKPLLEYDFETEEYKQREAKPQWEAYLEKQPDNGTISYKGEFIFMRMCYSVVGLWDNVLGKEKSRLNLYIERLPMAKQKILNGIKERRTNGN